MTMPSARQVESHDGWERVAGGHLQSLFDQTFGSNARNVDSLHRRGTVLFFEGEAARGVYILRTGRASVSISSSEGRIVILRMAQPGDVLGLNAVLRNCAYDATVKLVEPSRVNFISRTEVKRLVEQSDAAASAVIRLLSLELAQLSERTRSLLLPQTVPARLAQLLLQWSQDPQGDNSRSRVIDKVFTHEEMAQMICSSRETVTRVFAALTRRNIIQVTPDSVLIHDRTALESLSCSNTGAKPS
jgi:CRP/FNR family transcriptional regulator